VARASIIGNDMPTLRECKRLRRHLTSAALALWLFTPDALAESGQGAGLGPVIGVTWNGSLSLGWELGGSFAGATVLRLSMGGSYQLHRGQNDPGYFHYLAWEPWVYVGGTVGLALTDEREVRMIYGLWEGWAQDLGDPLFDASYDFLDDDTRQHWVFSLSLGWRGMGKTQQFYLTPKVWRIQGWDFFT
jgi:hypothetical protein